MKRSKAKNTRAAAAPVEQAPEFRTTLGRSELAGASLVELLVYGLAADGDEDLGLRVLEGARRDLHGVLGMVSPGSGAVSLPRVVDVLFSLERRLDVGLEIARRASEGKGAS